MENAKVNRPNSKELLFSTGPKSKKDIIKSLLREPSTKQGKKEKLETLKLIKSPLFEQVRNFLPEMKASTSLLMNKSKEEKEDLNIENLDGCKEVIEMNLLVGIPDVGDDSETDSDSDSNILNSDSESIKNILSNNGPISCPFSKKRKQTSIQEPKTDSKLPKKKLIIEVDSDNNC